MIRFAAMLLLAPALALAAPGVHAQQMASPPLRVSPRAPAPPPPMPEVTPGPSVRVYGYLAYWDDDLPTVPWDQLSDIALFTAGVQTDGTLTTTSRWSAAAEAVALAEPYGVHVHLTVANFSTSELRVLLGSETARRRLIDALVAWQADTGVHGFNIDFEGLPADRKTEMVAFTRDLAAEVSEVVLATPSVDWSGAWDYSELTRYADLFIMGYGYHYGGSSYAGPVDPLYGGGPWGQYSLDWTVRDYLANDADPSRVILGLPLYGERWPTSSDAVPASTTGGGSAVFFSGAWQGAATHGARFEEVSRAPWYWDGASQTWYGDTASVRERVQYAMGEGLGGFGFWALHYTGDDPDFWAMIADETAPEPDPDPDTDTDTDVPHDDRFQAEAGRPFLAYPGDTVFLSARGSTGPDGVALKYRWVQVQGPAVVLDDPTAFEPSFPVEQAGTTVFELTVGDGDAFSAPDRSYVVVLDRDLRTDRGCGCALGGSGPGAIGLIGLVLVAIRRRTRPAWASQVGVE